MVSKVTKKPWYRSRTYWFNIFIAALTTFVSLLNLFADASVLPVLPDDWAAWVVALSVIGNFVMRSITAGGVSMK